MYVYFLERLEGSIGSPGNGVMYVCKQQCGFLKPSPSSLEEKQVTLPANPFPRYLTVKAKFSVRRSTQVNLGPKSETLTTRDYYQ